MWAFKTLWDKGLIYEGFRVLAYCWRCETPLSNFETRMDDVYRDRQDPALTVWFELDEWRARARLDHDAVDAAVEPGARRRARHRLRGHGGGRAALRARRGPARRLRHASWPAPSGSAPMQGLRARRPPLPAAVRLLRRHAERVPGARRRLRVDRGGHRHRPHGTGLRRGRPDRVQRGRHPDDLPDGRARALHRAGHRLDRSARVRRQRRRDPPPQDRWRRRAPRLATTTRTRTAGGAQQPLVYRAVSSWFVEVTAFRDRMVELNEQIRWVPEHVKDGSFGKWIANARDWSISRNRFWGSPIPVWVSDSPEYPRTDVYGSLAELEARLRRRGHRPPPARRSTDWCAPTPTTRPAGRRCAACPRCSTAGSSRGRCRSPRCTTRSRTPSGSSTTIPATSSSSTSPRPAGGSTRCTCWRRRCSIGRRSRPA